MSSRYENIRISKLVKAKHISEWTFHICKKNNFFNLQQLLEYYKENGSFYALKNCGSKPNQELIEICRKYDNQIVENKNVIENLSLEELAKNEHISVRTYNICKYNDLNNLKKIFQFFWEKDNFKKLRNCGSKSNQELINICKKYKFPNLKTLHSYETPTPRNEIVEIIERLSIKQKAILNNTISIKFRELTQRSKNVLRNLLNNTITLKNLKKYIFFDVNFEIKSFRNIGEKAGKEINLFLKEIKELIILVSTFEAEEDLTKELFNAVIYKIFLVDRKTLSVIGENYDFSNGIPVFKTINILIKNNYIFKEREKIIFQKSLGFFENKKPLTLNNTGKTIGLTRERVRQIRNKLLDNFNQYFSFVGSFEEDNLNLYNLDNTSSILNVDQPFIDRLNKNEMVNYNVFFINRILSIILKEKYSLVGNEDKGILGKNSRYHYNWNSTYLISKQIESIFDFEKLINDILNRLSKKINETYKFHFQSYLLNFKKGDCFNYLNEITQVAEQILYNEFEMVIDNEDNISFEKNNTKSILDYIYNVLKKANKPLTVYEIYDLLNRQHPGTTKSPEALRGSCQRDERLIYFGRSSTYGLKIWEEKYTNIKGGTMHDISEEFLLKFDEPKHIDEIVEYVKKFRNRVTSKNLYYNLRSAEYRRFIFFQNGFIGLASKFYNTDLFLPIHKYYSKKESWEEKFYLLEMFITKNKRLPYLSENDKEIKLYKFFNVQVRNLSKLKDARKELIKNLMLKFNYQKRIVYKNLKWEQSYNELMSFLQKKKRMPSMQIFDEQKLYSFYHQQRKLFKKKRLFDEYLSKFMEITEIIKNIKR